jgi:hypothetical protein
VPIAKNGLEVLQMVQAAVDAGEPYDGILMDVQVLTLTAMLTLTNLICKDADHEWTGCIKGNSEDDLGNSTYHHCNDR